MSGTQNQYEVGLDKTQANFVALTPLSFLARTAGVYPDHISTVYEGRSFTWSETYARCRRFASYLAGHNVGHGDTVAAMLPNIPAMNELHFAVPMAGAVLNASTSGSMRPPSPSNSNMAAPGLSWWILNFQA
jgi:fatty-acyl-CoA synthase